MHLVHRSGVLVLLLLSTLVYLRRLKAVLGPAATGHPSTPYRIFLAALILVVKYVEDNPYRNKRWKKISYIETNGVYI